MDGDAVDLVAYVGKSVSWDLNLYCQIANAMQSAAKNMGIQNLRWGGAWNVHDIASYESTMEDAKSSYVEERKAKGRKPFIDGPHFELYVPGDVATRC